MPEPAPVIVLRHNGGGDTHSGGPLQRRLVGSWGTTEIRAGDLCDAGAPIAALTVSRENVNPGTTGASLGRVG